MRLALNALQDLSTLKNIQYIMLPIPATERCNIVFFPPPVPFVKNRTVNPCMHGAGTCRLREAVRDGMGPRLKSEQLFEQCDQTCGGAPGPNRLAMELTTAVPGHGWTW